MLLRDCIAAYLRKLTNDDCSVYHVRSVRSRLGMFARWSADGGGGVTGVTMGERPVGEVSRQALREHFAYLELSRTDGTMAGYSSTHQAFWRWCRRKGWVKRKLWKKLKKYSYEPRVRQAAPAEDVDLLAGKLFEFVSRRGRHPQDVRDALFVSLCIDSSGRRGAVWALRWCDMDQALERPRKTRSGRVAYRVTLLRDKTGTKTIRFFAESAELYGMWRAVAPRGSTADPVFVDLETGKRLHPESTSKAFIRLCKFAGIPVHRSQAIRKRIVTDVALDSGIDVASAFAGHTNISTTSRHYREYKNDQVDDAAARVADNRRGEGDFSAEMAKLFGVPGDG